MKVQVQVVHSFPFSKSMNETMNPKTLMCPDKVSSHGSPVNGTLTDPVTTSSLQTGGRDSPARRLQHLHDERNIKIGTRRMNGLNNSHSISKHRAALVSTLVWWKVVHDCGRHVKREPHDCGRRALERGRPREDWRVVARRKVGTRCIRG